MTDYVYEKDGIIVTFKSRAAMNSYFKKVREREYMIGRKIPYFCELHEALYIKQEMRAWPHADHDHVSGSYRGWLCVGCNMRLIPEIDRLRESGLEKGDILGLLRIAVDYVFSEGKNLNSFYKDRVISEAERADNANQSALRGRRETAMRSNSVGVYKGDDL